MSKVAVSVSPIRSPVPGCPTDAVFLLVFGVTSRMRFRLTPEDAAHLACEIARLMPAAAPLTGRLVPQLAAAVVHPPLPRPAAEPPTEPVW